MSNSYTSRRLCTANNLVRAGHVLLISGYLFFMFVLLASCNTPEQEALWKKIINLPTSSPPEMKWEPTAVRNCKKKNVRTFQSSAGIRNCTKWHGTCAWETYCHASLDVQRFTIESWFSFYPFGSDKILWQRQHEGGRLCFGSELRHSQSLHGRSKQQTSNVADNVVCHQQAETNNCLYSVRNQNGSSHINEQNQDKIPPPPRNAPEAHLLEQWFKPS